MDKRDFLKNISLAVLGAPFVGSALASCADEAAKTSPKKLAEKNDFWLKVREDYKLKPDYINLESGYYNIIPTPTLEALHKNIDMVNYEGSYYMRTVQWDNKKSMVSKLAKVVGTSDKNLIITRNTTESLDMVIKGMDWKMGDEAIYAKQDYGAMQMMFEQISKRYGTKNIVVSIPNHPSSDEEIVSIYENAITSKTKLLMVCHMINITGQILPIKKICEMAHRKGVQVMVDGAHCVGHFQFKINDLGCDYYASSLHKWLSTPLGAGLLYVNKKNISKIWPFFASGSQNLNNIKRLNHTGTHPVHTDIAISNAIDYINWIGVKKKEERLRFLQRYWSDKLRGKKNVLVNTPEDIQRSCGIGNVGLKNIKPGKMAQLLFDEYKIFTVAIDGANVHGCRISPNIFTTTEELDSLVNAVTELSQISS